MLSLSLALLASLVACLLLTPPARVLARRWGLVDRPDGRRKLHGQPIPLAGGLAVFTAVLAALATLELAGLTWVTDSLRAPELLGLLVGGAVICSVGVLDDLGRLRGRHKLLGQAVAVVVVIGCGVRVDRVVLFGWHLDLGLLAVPFTAFILLGAVNSLNLLDGMDGLLSSVGLIICLAMGVMAFGNGQVGPACVAFALAGALLGFLVYNLPPASAFLGDAGSMLIGLVVGVLAIQSSLKGPATVALAAPTAMLTLPIFDTLAAILRRKLTGRSIYATDRDHLHHCLLRRGLTNQGALLLLAGFCLLAVGGGLGSVAFNSELIALVTAAGLVATLLATRLFGHAELALLKKRLALLLPRFGRGQAEAQAQEVEVRLHGRLDWGDLWVLILNSVDQLNLRRVLLDVNAPAINECYHARWDRGHSGVRGRNGAGAAESEENGGWKAQLPLVVHNRVIAQVELTGERDDRPAWEKIGAMADLLREFERKAELLLAPVQNGDCGTQKEKTTDGTAPVVQSAICNLPSNMAPAGGS
jgi:UDP-GlcNAc:undecaprenyl-phosphate GlcNAc-1-phosphate transferase